MLKLNTHLQLNNTSPLVKTKQRGGPRAIKVILISPISTGIIAYDRTANRALIYVTSIYDLRSINQLTNHMYINGKVMKAGIYRRPDLFRPIRSTSLHQLQKKAFHIT